MKTKEILKDLDLAPVQKPQEPDWVTAELDDENDEILLPNYLNQLIVVAFNDVTNPDKAAGDIALATLARECLRRLPCLKGRHRALCLWQMKRVGMTEHQSSQ